MILEIFTIFDAVSKEYSTPFFQKNHDTAKRSFAVSMNRDVRPFPQLKDSDYSLLFIGTFDTDKGEIDLKGDGFVCYGNDCEVFDVHSDVAPQMSEKDLQAAIANSPFVQQLSNQMAAACQPKKKFSLFVGKK